MTRFQSKVKFMRCSIALQVCLDESTNGGGNLLGGYARLIAGLADGASSLNQ
jgi:hypothetical protein